MNLTELADSINKFNNSNPGEAKNVIKSDKEYRGNQYDLDNFINTIQYIEYKKTLKKKPLVGNPKEYVTHDNGDALLSILEEGQYKKKWSRLDTYCKREKISEYIEKEVDNGNIGQSNMKECIAHLFRLLEQKKLNKKGNIEYDSDNGKITSISKSLFDGVV